VFVGVASTVVLVFVGVASTVVAPLVVGEDEASPPDSSALDADGDAAVPTALVATVG
jgi:hypothetical protein